MFSTEQVRYLFDGCPPRLASIRVEVGVEAGGIMIEFEKRGFDQKIRANMDKLELISSTRKTEKM